MEVLRMDYRFTAILIIMITLLALFGGPAYPKNEYLNEYGVRCGRIVEDRTEQRYMIIIHSDIVQTNKIFKYYLQKIFRYRL